MTSFYKSIATNYDHIFPTSPPQISFVSSRIQEGGRVLDIGCATGGLAMALASKGYSVTGIDLDETMIDLAKAKSAITNLDVTFFQADMTKLDLEGSFDGVVCLGNTLVHLDEARVLCFLRWVRSALAQDGKFICQILNYDRIFAQNVESLPTIENEAIRFHRTYKPGDSKSELIFHTVLTIKSTGECLENEIGLYPLGTLKLNHLLTNAGFNNTKLFGDLKGSPFDRDSSFPLVFVASKD